MIHDLYNLIRSGRVMRWHSNPDMSRCGEDLAQHQWSTAIIALRLDPHLSRDAMIWCLTHDSGEMVAGDLSYDFKRANPGIAEAHAEAETDARDKLVSGCNVLSIDEWRVVKLADWLSAYATMIRHEPWLRFRADWVAQREKCIASIDDADRLLAMLHFIEALHNEAHARDGR